MLTKDVYKPIQIVHESTPDNEDNDIEEVEEYNDEPEENVEMDFTIG